MEGSGNGGDKSARRRARSKREDRDKKASKRRGKAMSKEEKEKDKKERELAREKAEKEALEREKAEAEAARLEATRKKNSFYFESTALSEGNLFGRCLFRLTDIFRGVSSLRLVSPLAPAYPIKAKKRAPFQMHSNPYEDSAAYMSVQCRAIVGLAGFDSLPHRIVHPFTRAVYVFRYKVYTHSRVYMHLTHACIYASTRALHIASRKHASVHAHA